MTVLSSLLRVGERAIKSEQFWGAWSRGDDVGVPLLNSAGVVVDRNTAMQLSAVWACATLIADSISTLPADAFFRFNGTRKPYRPRPPWIDEPNPEQETPQWVSQQLLAMLFDGTAYVSTLRDSKGDVIEAWNVPPWLVRPHRVGRGQIEYRVTDPEYGQITLDRSQMFHIPGISWPGEIRGMAPLEAARTMLGVGLGSQEYAARYYSQGMTHRGMIEHPDDLQPGQAKELKDDFARVAGGLRNAHLPPVLTGGAKWREMTVTPEQAQFLESRSFSVSEVCRFFRVPPHMIADVEKDSSWGTGIEQQGIGFVTYTLRPWIERIERAYTRSLLLFQPGVFTKFNVNGLMRGDFKTRMEGYAIGRNWGWLSADDVLSLEDMSPLPNKQGQQYLVPLNMRPADAPFQQPTGGGTING